MYQWPGLQDCQQCQLDQCHPCHLLCQFLTCLQHQLCRQYPLVPDYQCYLAGRCLVDLHCLDCHCLVRLDCLDCLDCLYLHFPQRQLCLAVPDYLAVL